MNDEVSWFVVSLRSSRFKTLRLCEKTTEVSSPRKRGSIPFEHKLDSRRVVYDPTGHRPVRSLRPTFVGMTKPEVLVFTQSQSLGTR